VEVVNGLGAGDAFVATFVQRLHVGLRSRSSTSRSVAGAIVLPGWHPRKRLPHLKELEAELA